MLGVCVVHVCVRVFVRVFVHAPTFTSTSSEVFPCCTRAKIVAHYSQSIIMTALVTFVDEKDAASALAEADG